MEWASLFLTFFFVAKEERPPPPRLLFQVVCFYVTRLRHKVQYPPTQFMNQVMTPRRCPKAQNKKLQQRFHSVPSSIEGRRLQKNSQKTTIRHMRQQTCNQSSRIAPKAYEKRMYRTNNKWKGYLAFHKINYQINISWNNESLLTIRVSVSSANSSTSISYS